MERPWSRFVLPDLPESVLKYNPFANRDVPIEETQGN